MAYLHCHNCDFSQDDFYSRGYNLVTKIWSDIKWLYKPRWIRLDDWILIDLVNYAKIPVHIRICKDDNRYVLSWNWLLLEIVKNIKLFFKMKYITWKSWRRAVERNGGKWPACPKCNVKALDID